MSASKYIRPMGFGQLILSTIRIYAKSFWPLWLIAGLITFTVFQIYFMVEPYLSYFQPLAFLSYLLPFLIYLLPAFFVGPAMLTISNIILERPRKTWASFSRGMSLSMMLKLFLFFFPIMILIILRLTIYNIDRMILYFYIPFFLFVPVWVFYPMILLLERKSILESVRRSITVISGNFIRLLQIHILLSVLTGLVIYLCLPIFSWIADLAFLTSPLTLGFAITMYVLHYYQVRSEKENFNEELLAQELGYQPIEEMMTV